MKNRFISSSVLLVLFSMLFSGCSILQSETPVVFPTTDANRLRTEVAQTMVARMTYEAAQTRAAEPTQTVQVSSPTSEIGTATSSPTITLTPTLPVITFPPSATVPTATPTETVRVIYPTFTPTYYPDRAELVSQSPAWGTSFSPGVGFDLNFGIKNTGELTWNSNYYLKHNSGVTGQTHSGQNITLIYLPASTAPGETVNLVIDMVAPKTAGYYASTWSLINDEGKTILSMTLTFYVSSE